ncbi:hypothetical protein [Flavobacterium sp.]|uniref:hypothetical protein n=1 Tax=Flavobacterium sp. TaxID=239 RepID=UPI003BC66D97
MKKIFLFIVLSFTISSSFAQKKKPISKSTSLSVFAKVDNLVAEIKNGIFQIRINENGTPKDVIEVKKIESIFTPTNLKFISFNASGILLYLLTWTESSQTKTNLKIEDTSVIYSNIYEIGSKKLVFSNKKVLSHIVEKVFLDKLKNASETQERKHSEGFEFKLNPDGSIIQKTKTQENKLVYDVAKMQYLISKKK